MSSLITIHIWTSSISYLMFGFAFAIGNLYTYRYRVIKHKRLTLPDRFPWSMARLEDCLRITTVTGFILLNLAIPTGILIQREIIGQINIFSPRIIFPFFIWFYYLFILVIGRLAGIRGIRHANFSAHGFQLMCFSFIFELFLLITKPVMT